MVTYPWRPARSRALLSRGRTGRTGHDLNLMVMFQMPADRLRPGFQALPSQFPCAAGPSASQPAPGSPLGWFSAGGTAARTPPRPRPGTGPPACSPSPATPYRPGPPHPETRASSYTRQRLTGWNALLTCRPREPRNGRRPVRPARRGNGHAAADNRRKAPSATGFAPIELLQGI